MIEAVTKQIRVRATPKAAFRRFTEEIESWWPMATHSVTEGRCRSVVWKGPAGSDVYEVDEEGERHVWGTFSVWEPPTRFAMSWHPGRGVETAQQIEVTFELVDGETVVTVTHDGFDRLGETARETRDRYDGGWQRVLYMYREALA